MALYSYTARNMIGSRITGEIEANDLNEIRTLLRDKNLFLVAAGSSEDSAVTRNMRRPPGVTENAMMTRQLALLIEAGVPIISALRVLIQQTPNRMLVRALQSVRQDVIDGKYLSDGMAKHPEVFTDVQRTLVRVGETGGVLPEMLNRAARQLEVAAELRRKLVGAFVYPLVVLATAIMVVGLMLVLVVPVFADIYSRFHVQLPVPTQLLIHASDAVIKYGWIFVLAAALAFAWLKSKLKQPKMRLRMDGMKLRMPIFGDFFKKLAISHFSYSLSSMLQSGVPILTAMTVSGDVCGNVLIGKAIERASRFVSEGKSISMSIEEAGIFPPMMISIVDAGEHASKLSEMLEHLAVHFEGEVDHAMARIAKILEPALTAVVGIFVAVVLAALYMPIFTLGKVMSK